MSMKKSSPGRVGVGAGGSRSGVYGDAESKSIRAGGAAAAASIRDRVNRDCGRDLLSTRDLQNFSEQNSGWGFRLDQVDKDLEREEKAMEDMMKEMQGWKSEMSGLGTGKSPSKAGGRGAPSPGPDYQAVSRRLARERAPSRSGP